MTDIIDKARALWAAIKSAWARLKGGGGGVGLYYGRHAGDVEDVWSHSSMTILKYG